MKRKQKKLPLFENKLLSAVNFVSLCQSDKGNEIAQYCRVENGAVIAFDGIVAMGALTGVDLDACPHTLQFGLALARCEETFAITQLDAERIQVRSGEFQAFIPCCDAGKLLQAAPDASIASLDAPFIDALGKVTPIAPAKAKSVLYAAIQIHSGTCAATNGAIILEAWHGIDLPSILVPKYAAAILIKCGKKPVSFGYTQRTATFWFEDGSWLRTNLFEDQVPDLRTELNKESRCEMHTVAPEFFKAVDAVGKFSQDGYVYCIQDYVGSHRNDDVGGNMIKVENGLVNRAYNIKWLKQVSKLATFYDEFSWERGTRFKGENLRGAIAHVLLDRNETPANIQHGPPPKGVTQEECIASGGNPGCGTDGCPACGGIPF